MKEGADPDGLEWAGKAPHTSSGPSIFWECSLYYFAK